MSVRFKLTGVTAWGHSPASGCAPEKAGALKSANVKKIVLAVSIGILLFGPASGVVRADPPPSDTSALSSEIIGKYIQATQDRQAASEAASMEVDINASIPRLQQNGRLHALRVISRMGRVTYRVLGFQGSNAVKSQVIGRYLQAEQQGQSNDRMAITPANYKFKFKGEREIGMRGPVYVFALAPRKSGFGLFKGEIWIDRSTYLPVYEKGRLVKNPSVFFKRVEFERAFSIQGGKAVPEHMNSVISTRVVGKVSLEISYSNYAQSSDAGEADGGTSLRLTSAGR